MSKKDKSFWEVAKRNAETVKKWHPSRQGVNVVTKTTNTGDLIKGDEKTMTLVNILNYTVTSGSKHLIALYLIQEELRVWTKSAGRGEEDKKVRDLMNSFEYLLRGSK